MPLQRQTKLKMKSTMIFNKRNNNHDDNDDENVIVMYIMYEEKTSGFICGFD